MVDITDKKQTTRLATASSTLFFSHSSTYSCLVEQHHNKGDAIAVARIASIQAAKKTSDLIPLAHPSLSITSVSVQIEPFSADQKSLQTTLSCNGQRISEQDHKFGGVTVCATVKCQGKTGIEMEAITAAAMGTITLYDMLKAVDKGMVINGARVIEKQGGKSGDWYWDEQASKLSQKSTEETNLSNEQSRQRSREDTAYRPVLSEVEEWNDGLAAEFSIPRHQKNE